MSDEQEPAYRCSHCPRLLYADELTRYVCRVCEDRATTQLQALPGLYGQLERALVPGATSHGCGKVTATRHAPLPVSLQPLNLRGPGGIVTELQFIEDSWRRALGWTVAPFRGSLEQTLGPVVAFLTNNVPWACSSFEEVADDLDTIARLYFQAKNTVTGYRPRLVPVTCRAEFDDGTECGQQLRIDINRSLARCPSCGTRWGREEWVRLYEATTSVAA